ncbi:esterase-like activity of phytase family protein [Erythrobacter sp.]|uniref:esterase-like activity of phytase family protein n=1 Tax=Erythrobacter sp. TaxID=1042 RepID=UPI001B16DFEB|nr:esterase-like activity of phytase family protein [Erythrobacter sp.]MBO6528138.1 esterase-like activity of phytase family protein [Erythrobacter sp.]MBO6530860.1 esterase-like activity of phytase family protein [Erythrobacter sp.]
MRPKRLLLALMLAGVLAPGTWLRDPELPRNFHRAVAIEPLDQDFQRSGPFALVAAWELTGDRVQFGGLSALVALDGMRFLAGSDTGRKLVFERPDRSSAPGELSRLGENETSYKLGRDLESLAIDPVSGTVWGGFEFRESIVRFDADLKPDEEVRPAEMSYWGANSGAESLARLADGRFLVIEERPRRWREPGHRALLFAGDPIEERAPEELRIAIPAGYRPVDATPVEGGTALVLLRRVSWGIPPVFESAIAEVDVDRHSADGTIAAALLTEFGPAIPQDNYEGIALTRDADGTHVWLISDDNFMSIQRTLLLKLRWDQREKARE